jgi:hypothetical protein
MSALGQSGHTQLRYSHTFCNSASGIYLACYFFGGLVGTAVLGLIFDGLVSLGSGSLLPVPRVWLFAFV